MKKIISYITLLVFVMQLIAGCKSTTTSKKPTSPSLDSQRITSSTADERKSNVTSTPAEHTELGSMPVSLSLPNATVSVLDCESDTASKEISMNLSVTWLDNSSCSREFKVERLTPSSYDRSAKLDLVDSTGNALYEYIIDYDTIETGGLKITEQTHSDQMTFTYRDDGNLTAESYNINGNQRNYSYPSISRESKEATVDYYRKFENAASLSKMAPSGSPEISGQYLQVLRDFDVFYTPTVNNTLHNNREGELLAYLSSSETVAQIIQDNLGLTRKPRPLLCDLCDICVLLKCMYGGGPANTLCATCIGCSVLCIIFERLFS